MSTFKNKGILLPEISVSSSSIYFNCRLCFQLWCYLSFLCMLRVRWNDRLLVVNSWALWSARETRRRGGEARAGGGAYSAVLVIPGQFRPVLERPAPFKQEDADICYCFKNAMSTFGNKRKSNIHYVSASILHSNIDCRLLYFLLLHTSENDKSPCPEQRHETSINPEIIV